MGATAYGWTRQDQVGRNGFEIRQVSDGPPSGKAQAGRLQLGLPLLQWPFQIHWARLGNEAMRRVFAAPGDLQVAKQLMRRLDRVFRSPGVGGPLHHTAELSGRHPMHDLHRLIRPHDLQPARGSFLTIVPGSRRRNAREHQGKGGLESQSFAAQPQRRPPWDFCRTPLLEARRSFGRGHVFSAAHLYFHRRRLLAADGCRHQSSMAPSNENPNGD